MSVAPFPTCIFFVPFTLYRATRPARMRLICCDGLAGADCPCCLSNALSGAFQFNSLQGNLATQLLAFPYLLRQWALPLWLNIDPDLPLLFFSALFALMLVCRRKRLWIGFALAWAIIYLLALYLFLPRAATRPGTHQGAP